MKYQANSVGRCPRRFPSSGCFSCGISAFPAFSRIHNGVTSFVFGNPEGYVVYLFDERFDARKAYVLPFLVLAPVVLITILPVRSSNFRYFYPTVCGICLVFGSLAKPLGSQFFGSLAWRIAYWTRIFGLTLLTCLFFWSLANIKNALFYEIEEWRYEHDIIGI